MPVSRDGVAWAAAASVSIVNGAVVALDATGVESVLLEEIQSCLVQVFNQKHTADPLLARRRFGKRSDIEPLGADEPPVVFIRSYDNEKLYLRVVSRAQLGNLLAALLAWQNMKPQGLAKKWYAHNKVWNTTPAGADPHELLVCRFKVYGPIPARARTVNVVKGPRAPFHQLRLDAQAGGITSNTVSASAASAGSGAANAASGAGLLLLLLAESSIHEGWFFTMGVLKLNGVLNFITELDGTLLYLIDVKGLLASEIRELHHLICDTANVLFLGHIKELRWNNVLKSTTSLTQDALANPSLLVKDGRPVANNSRILIEFPLHIDLEDWLVGLTYFSKREYIGVFDEKSVLLASSKRVIGLESTIDADSTVDTLASESTILADAPPTQPAKLANFSRDLLRVSKKLTLDIIEAKLDSVPHGTKSLSTIYAEVVMWGFPWARTALVPLSNNPFWKEEFFTDLPILTRMIHIVIKQSSTDGVHSYKDKIIGTVYLTPDVLTQQLRLASTMMVDHANGGGVSMLQLTSHNLNAAMAATSMNSNIVRLSIYDGANLPIGKLLLSVDLKEYMILSPPHFRTLESMLVNCPMKQLIEFCNSNVMTSEFENVSFILLDIFHSLGIEEKWFKALIEAELVNLDKATRKNYAAKNSSSSTNNVFNTLFRGSSIFTKSLEKYIFRIGQEYLEKVFGDFFETVIAENKNCEIDPRYVRQQMSKRGRLTTPGSSDDEFGSEDEYDSDAEREREAQVQRIIDSNYVRLRTYVETIWRKIYSTSNDLPQQMKTQLKNFRNKIDMVCDPEDKTTALNCVSAFMFLRFFCPVILNPKLFYLTKSLQTGNASRTLTLVAKILLNLANRLEFLVHKEPHLVRMNTFLKDHEPELFDYFDKITERKNDFNEKILDLSHEMKRFDLGLGADDSSSELPTTPYLIDKYLRLTEFVHLLKFNGHSRSHSQSRASVSSSSINTTLSQVPSTKNLAAVLHERSESEEDADLKEDERKYQIGSLEFEKSEFLDLVGDNETEGFIKTLCRSNEEIFSFISSNFTLKDLQKHSTNLVSTVTEMSLRLQQGEQCASYQHDARLWEAFVDDVVSRAVLDSARNQIVFYDSQFQESLIGGQRKLAESGLLALKLRFPVEYKGGESALIVESFSLQSLYSEAKPLKNRLRRFFKRE